MGIISCQYGWYEFLLATNLLTHSGGSDLNFNKLCWIYANGVYFSGVSGIIVCNENNEKYEEYD